ncbi:MAG: GIY-YIG nuclease family protein [Candidatus Omnitrophica bacterium]|nr:GIY-YIG nuclease family protein [Candidatus Omnitrophota bacterium]
MPKAIFLSGNNHIRYYGHTNNLTKRLNEHLKGRVQSTRDKQPIELIYYKEFNSRSEAFKREIQFKNGKTRKKTIEKLINSFPKTKCQGFNSDV